MRDEVIFKTEQSWFFKRIKINLSVIIVLMRHGAIFEKFLYFCLSSSSIIYYLFSIESDMTISEIFSRVVNY